LSRLHNNANVLALGQRLIDWETAEAMIRLWLETPFEGGRHERRIAKIEIDG
jgi:ribose 5-phosphate isomerase B